MNIYEFGRMIMSIVDNPSDNQVHQHVHNKNINFQDNVISQSIRFNSSFSHKKKRKKTKNVEQSLRTCVRTIRTTNIKHR